MLRRCSTRNVSNILYLDPTELNDLVLQNIAHLKRYQNSPCEETKQHIHEFMWKYKMSKYDRMK